MGSHERLCIKMMDSASVAMADGINSLGSTKAASRDQLCIPSVLGIPCVER